MERFIRLIEEKAGIRINDTDKLRFAIDEMLTLTGVASEAALLNLVDSDPASFEELVAFLTVNETYFFRERVQLTVLVEKLIPELLKKNTGRKLRIVSAGCSTGAEPYSIVMALMEKYGQINSGNLFSVVGFDIDKKALNIAKNCIYGKYYFRGVEPCIIDTYFERIAGERFQLKPHVSDMVSFYSHNLLHAPYPGEVRNADIIFYRNVSIYFNSDNQKRIFSNLAENINTGGALIMSATETFPHNYSIMSLENLDSVFFYRKKTPEGGVAAEERRFEVRRPKKLAALKRVGKLITNGKQKGHTRVKSEPVKPTGEAAHDRCQLSDEERMIKAWQLAKSKKHHESLEMLETLFESGAPPVKAYTIQASILISLGRLEDARLACHRAIAADDLWMEGYFLLGIIEKLENNLSIAEEKFKKAIYIDPSCWLANYYLAEIYKEQESTDKSIRKYEVVVNHLEKNRAKETGLSFCAFNFSEREIVQACRQNMAQLKKGRPE